MRMSTSGKRLTDSAVSTDLLRSATNDSKLADGIAHLVSLGGKGVDAVQARRNRRALIDLRHSIEIAYGGSSVPTANSISKYLSAVKKGEPSIAKRIRDRPKFPDEQPSWNASEKKRKEWQRNYDTWQEQHREEIEAANDAIALASHHWKMVVRQCISALMVSRDVLVALRKLNSEFVFSNAYEAISRALDSRSGMLREFLAVEADNIETRYGYNYDDPEYSQKHVLENVYMRYRYFGMPLDDDELIDLEMFAREYRTLIDGISSASRQLALYARNSAKRQGGERSASR